MKKMKTLTINGQTYAIDDADSAASLIVAMDIPNKKCSHTAGQIYAHVQAGGLAVALAAGEYLPLLVCSSQTVSFGQTTVAGSASKTLEITVDGSGQITVKNVTVTTSGGGGGGGGGATVDEVIEELGKTRIPYMTVDDAEVKRVLLTDVGGEGINVEHVGRNVLHFQETADDNNVILRGIAAAEQDTDAVNYAQFTDAIGDIESALDRIIEIQNSLIGGEA